MTEGKEQGLCPVRVNIDEFHCRLGVSIFRLIHNVTPIVLRRAGSSLS